MTDQYRATPEQWATHEACAKSDDDSSCILELRDTIRALCIARNDLVVCSTEQNQRIEALEAAQLDQAESHRFCVDAIAWRVEALEAAYKETAMDELRAASAEAQPGGLVERVANAISGEEFGGWHPEARDAIREVAKWLRDRYPKSPEAGAVAFNLCQEANHG